MTELGNQNISYLNDKLTEKIIESIITVHQTLGPGFLENIYRNSLIVELEKSGLICETEKEIEVFYNGQKVGKHRLDILVENKIICEIKTVEMLAGVHYAQIKSY